MGKDIERRLEKLERSQAPAIELLFDAYEEIYQYALGDADQESRQFVVKTAIKWVLCSFRQLDTNSLRYMVSIQPDGTMDDDVTPELILEYCSNFIVQTSAGSIKLAHLSVRQFFEERKSAEFSASRQHLQVSMTCMILVRSLFIEDTADETEFFQSELQYLPRLRSKLIRSGGGVSALNNYPYLHWSIHCRAAFQTIEVSGPIQPTEVSDVLFPHLDSIHWMVAQGKDLAAQDILGNCLLHNMVLENNLHGIELLLRVDTLLERSRLLSIQNKQGNTAIHLAAMMGRDERFHALFIAGSKMETTNKHGLTPAHLAVIFGRDRIVQRIADISLYILDKSGNSLLHYASFFGRTSAVRNFIKSSWDKNAQNDDGNTPLHLAVQGGSLSVIQKLVSAGVSLDILNAEKKLPEQDLGPELSEMDAVVAKTIRQPKTASAAVSARHRLRIDDPDI